MISLLNTKEMFWSIEEIPQTFKLSFNWSIMLEKVFINGSINFSYLYGTLSNFEDLQDYKKSNYRTLKLTNSV
jgi:hypothetical protein